MHRSGEPQKNLTDQYAVAFFLLLAAGGIIALTVAAMLRPSGPPVVQACVKEELIDGKAVCTEWLVKEKQR